MLTQKKLKEILHYDSSSGLFTRLRTNKFADVRQDARGYRKVYIGGRYYYSHRLAFLYMIGKLPSDDVDHINGIKSDNSWDNLREATRSQNFMNKASPKRSLPRGVVPVNSKYRARIKLGGTEIHGGYFATPEEAGQKAKELRERYFKEYRYQEE